jgi:hypothetical protein
MYVIPSHGRLKKLKELCESMSASDRAQPVLVVVCDQDPTHPDYFKETWPESWRLRVAYGEYSYCGEKMNWALKNYPNLRFYGHLCDDVLLTGKDTLAELSEAAGDWYMSYPCDGIYNTDLICFPVTGGNLIREIGWWAHPMFKHNCLDSVLTDIAKTLRIEKPMMHLRYIVKHPLLGTAEWDDTYRRVEPINREAGHLFDTKWRDSEERRALMVRLGNVLDSAEVARV